MRRTTAGGSSDEAPTSLDRLPLGATAVVTGIDVDAAGSVLARRLGDLGFLPGTEVAAVRRAPLGDPTVFELRGVRLSMRRRDIRAIGIQVRDERPAVR